MNDDSVLNVATEREDVPFTVLLTPTTKLSFLVMLLLA